MSPEAEAVKEAVVDTQQAALVNPEQEGSLSDLLDKRKSTQIFSGHPADTAIAGPEGEETVTGEEGGIVAVTTPEATVKPEPLPKEEVKYKHSTWEETERARLEAERRMTEATTEAADLKKRLADREAADRAAEETARAAAAQRNPEEIRAAAKDKVKATIEKIDSLDEEDPDYRDKVADAWAEAGLGSAVAAPDKTEIAKLVEEQVQNTLKAEREASAEKDRATEVARTRDNAQALAAKSGLDMKQGSVDYRLFWDVARDIPPEFVDQPLDDQVGWTVDEVRRLKGEVVKTKEQKAAEAKKLQLQQSVLEKGPERVVPVTTREPYSINAIVQKQQDTRRI
jgi:hypothetical protein